MLNGFTHLSVLSTASGRARRVHGWSLPVFVVVSRGGHMQILMPYQYVHCPFLVKDTGGVRTEGSGTALEGLSKVKKIEV